MKRWIALALLLCLLAGLAGCGRVVPAPKPTETPAVPTTTPGSAAL